MSAQRISLHIDTLVLHGVPDAHRERVGEAVRQELARLIVDAGLPAAWSAGGAVPGWDAGVVTVAPGTAPEAMGAQVARAVYSGPGAGEGGR